MAAQLMRSQVCFLQALNLDLGTAYPDLRCWFLCTSLVSSSPGLAEPQNLSAHFR